MRVPVEVIRKLRVGYGGWKELHRFAAAAGWSMTAKEARLLWKGEWDGVRLGAVEEFLLVTGHGLKVTKVLGEWKRRESGSIATKRGE